MTTRTNPRPTIRRRALLTGAAGLTAGALGATALAGCDAADASGRVQLDYWMWDANQLPGYSQAIDLFMKQNPDIEVRITQLGWDDYWTKLTASFVAEAGPDVFTDHLARFPEFVRLGVIAPLDGIAEIDALPADHFQDGLQELWTGQDGKRYGLPKDYDTVAVMYDKAVLEEAGVTGEELAGLDWNPEDGGSFERMIAHLSVDSQGRRGDEDGFDASDVAMYGLASYASVDYVGQTNWSPFALSTGWTFTDSPTWGTRFNYDDERFAASIDWYFGLVEKGFLPPFGKFGDSSPPQTQVQGRKAALATAGSWMIGTYSGLDGVDLGIAPLPSGPIGTPISMFNGLGDSIASQTEHRTEAGKLIAFLGSDASQEIIGGRGIVFPATDAGTEAAISAYESKKLDVAPFTDRVELKQTGQYPLTENSASIASLLQPAFDQAWLGRISGADFASYNDRVNALFS
ncbi:ABC transporter substrate-binding protein [Brachybacterium sp. AOP25-B2-12]|uniref:ABC transporter substrate-binding protein n=1 Tax=Brachybacterium sp. AOP25-B2-12 TaxID=3457710 RepID=UPI004033CD7B